MTSTDAEDRPIVIAGASHAAVSVAAELRAKAYVGPILLIGDEVDPPYHRPHLSKESLGAEMPAPAFLRPPAFYADQGIECRTGLRVEAIDRQRRQVVLSNGDRIVYRHLILATGAEPRGLPETVKGASLALSLRHKADWSVFSCRLMDARHIAIIGGGLIGLEVAAAARAANINVTVVEAGPRLIARSLYPALAEEVLRRHEASGVKFLLNKSVEAIEGNAVRLANGTVLDADLVLASIGSKPRDGLAHDATLATDDGILVDSLGRTSDPQIFAVGDCARWADPQGGFVRHESVAATLWHARCLVAGMLGLPAPEQENLRMWSTQGTMKLQMAGPVFSDAHVTLEHIGGGILLRAFKEAKLIAVQALDAPRAFKSEVRRIGSSEQVAMAVHV